MKEGTIKFYFWNVSDTFTCCNTTDVSRIHKFINSFDKNLQFTSEISLDGISIYLNDHNTVLYVNKASFVPRSHFFT